MQTVTNNFKLNKKEICSWVVNSKRDCFLISASGNKAEVSYLFAKMGI